MELYEGEKVRLRAVELSDLDEIMKNWNNLKMRQYLTTIIPYSRHEEEEWIKSTSEGKKTGRAYHFAIEKLDTREFLGTCGLFDINNISHSAILGIAIHAEKNWGKGYGTDAMKILERFGFDYLNLNRIELIVISFNIRGIKTYKKVGFVEVGKLRQAHYMNGQYYDLIVMDVLREEWIKQKKG